MSTHCFVLETHTNQKAVRVADGFLIKIVSYSEQTALAGAVKVVPW